MLNIPGGTACKFTDFLVAYLNFIVERILNKISFNLVLEFCVTIYFYVLNNNKDL